MSKRPAGHVDCPDCGEWVSYGNWDIHACDPRKRADLQHRKLFVDDAKEADRAG